MERLTHVTIVDKDILDLLPGEMTSDANKKYWFLGCPLCKEPGALAGHGIVVQPDTDDITVSPSILCKCGAHYYVEHNQIRWV